MLPESIVIAFWNIQDTCLIHGISAVFVGGSYFLGVARYLAIWSLLETISWLLNSIRHLTGSHWTVLTNTGVRTYCRQVENQSGTVFCTGFSILVRLSGSIFIGIVQLIQSGLWLNGGSSFMQILRANFATWRILGMSLRDALYAI